LQEKYSMLTPLIEYTPKGSIGSAAPSEQMVSNTKITMTLIIDMAVMVAA
jgi:hypothetical protein